MLAWMYVHAFMLSLNVMKLIEIDELQEQAGEGRVREWEIPRASTKHGAFNGIKQIFKWSGFILLRTLASFDRANYYAIW